MHKTCARAQSLFLVASLAACGVGPADTVRQIGLAIEENNVLRFESLVDVEAVLRSLVDATALGPESDDDVREVASQISGLVLGDSLSLAWVINAVLASDGVPSNLHPDSSHLVHYGIGETQQEGERALVELRLRHPFTVDTIGVFLEVTRGEGGDWRLVGLRGLDMILDGLVDDSPETHINSMQRSLRIITSLEEIYYADNYHYSSSAEAIGFIAEPDVSVTISSDERAVWSGTAEHVALPGVRCVVWYGLPGASWSAPSTLGGEVTRPGETRCDPVPVDTAYATLGM